MKRGPRPKGTVVLSWSPHFAYAIGLLAADGCLSKDGRHIDFTSKDRSQAVLFKKCLGLPAKISVKYSGSGNLAYCVQFSDVLFYHFLQSIGLSPAKSKTISRVLVPDEYFIDFLRGYFDGDGSSFSYYDSVFRNSYRFYISFTSASPKFIAWLRAKINSALSVRGSVGHNRNNPYVQLRYSKQDAVVISKNMYYAAGLPCLGRKHLKIQRSLRIMKQCRGGEIGRRAAFRTLWGNP